MPPVEILQTVELSSREPFEDGEHCHNQIKSTEDKDLYPDRLLRKCSISPDRIGGLPGPEGHDNTM